MVTSVGSSSESEDSIQNFKKFRPWLPFIHPFYFSEDNIASVSNIIFFANSVNAIRQSSVTILAENSL
jgi:hypothetical protein